MLRGENNENSQSLMALARTQVVVPSDNVLGENDVVEETEHDDGFKPITSEEELERIVRDRVKEAMLRRRKKEVLRKERIKSRWLAGIAIFLLAFLVLVLVIAFYPVPLSSHKLIYRSLYSANWYLEEKPDPLPEMAWESNLPKFILKDMNKVVKDDCFIEYYYGDSRIKIERKQSRFSKDYYWVISVIGDEKLSVDFNGPEDLSVFKTDSSVEFYVKGKYSGFYVITMEEKAITAEKLVTNYKNVPLSVNDEYSWNIGEYTLVRDDQTFSLWSNGREQDSVTFEEGKIFVFSKDYSLIGTTNNKLYSVFVYKDFEYYKPHIDIQYIGEIDNVGEIQPRAFYDEFLTFTFPLETNYHFPVFKVDGEYYSCLPENIKDWVSYSTANVGDVGYFDNLNMNVNLVRLEDCFKSAKIYYDYVSTYDLEGFSWVADVTFSYNDVDFVYEKCPIMGYDREYRLSDEEEESLEKKVYTIDGYWDAVEAIRKTYESHYDKRN